MNTIFERTIVNTFFPISFNISYGLGAQKNSLIETTYVLVEK